jgi:hypothetical protein
MACIVPSRNRKSAVGPPPEDKRSHIVYAVMEKRVQLAADEEPSYVARVLFAHDMFLKWCEVIDRADKPAHLNVPFDYGGATYKIVMCRRTDIYRGNPGEIALFMHADYRCANAFPAAIKYSSREELNAILTRVYL